MENRISVLYVDDEVNNLQAFKANFRKDYEIFIAESAAEGIKTLKENKIHIIMSDQRMPNMTGVEFLGSIINEYPDPIRMLITGYSDIAAVIDAINIGKVYNYITKPWSEKELKVIIEHAFEVYTLREEKKQLIEKLMRANEQLEFLLRQKLLS